MEQKVVQKSPERAKKQAPNLTGIPTQMKLDFERRSGLSFDDVRVHYNSDKPRKIGALAYTQGNQVHVGPGQERHLRHELGHVVQQKQGRVSPEYAYKGKKFNFSTLLEKEADGVVVKYNHIFAPTVSRYGEVIQGEFKHTTVTISGIAYNQVGAGKRIQFSDSVYDFYLPEGGESSVNHILAYSVLQSLFIERINTMLREKADQLRQPLSKSAVVPSGESAKKLQKIVHIVLPKVLNQYCSALSYGAEKAVQSSFSKKFAEQQKKADSIITTIIHRLHNAKVIDEQYVTSQIPEYESLMSLINESVCNLRLGDSRLNSGIREKLDPILNSHTITSGTFFGNYRAVIFCNNNAHGGLMAQRLHRLLSILVSSVHIDKIRFAPYFGDAVASSDYLKKQPPGKGIMGNAFGKSKDYYLVVIHSKSDNNGANDYLFAYVCFIVKGTIHSMQRFYLRHVTQDWKCSLDTSFLVGDSNYYVNSDHVKDLFLAIQKTSTSITTQPRTVSSLYRTSISPPTKKLRLAKNFPHTTISPEQLDPINVPFDATTKTPKTPKTPSSATTSSKQVTPNGGMKRPRP